MSSDPTSTCTVRSALGFSVPLFIVPLICCIERSSVPPLAQIQHPEVSLQVVDDVEGHTLAAASTQSKQVRESLGDASAATVVRSICGRLHEPCFLVCMPELNVEQLCLGNVQVP
jgi:hypothetical protein